MIDFYSKRVSKFSSMQPVTNIWHILVIIVGGPGDVGGASVVCGNVGGRGVSSVECVRASATIRSSESTRCSTQSEQYSERQQQQQPNECLPFNDNNRPLHKLGSNSATTAAAAGLAQ